MNKNKFGLINRLVSTKVLTRGTDISDEYRIRVVITGAGAGNTVIIKARITGEPTFSTTLATLDGSVNQTFDVFTYDEIYVECTMYVTTGNHVLVVASSFNEADRTTLGVLTGDALTSFNDSVSI